MGKSIGAGLAVLYFFIYISICFILATWWNPYSSEFGRIVIVALVIVWVIGLMVDE